MRPESGQIHHGMVADHEAVGDRSGLAAPDNDLLADERIAESRDSGDGGLLEDHGVLDLEPVISQSK